MVEAPEHATEQPDYLSYLLRLWRAPGEAAAWRASLESPHGGERLGFGSLDELFAFLREQTGTTPGLEETGSPAAQRTGWETGIDRTTKPLAGRRSYKEKSR